MIKRFTRRRRGESAKKSGEAIDAGLWLTRIAEEGLAGVSKLEAIGHESISDRVAVVGRGETESGDPVVVAFSPTHAGNALFAALATGARLAAEESFKGEVFAIAPVWSITARRRFGLVRAELPFKLRTVEASGLRASPRDVEAEADLEPSAVRIDGVAMQLVDPGERALFARGVSCLEGLAAKHGGGIRAVGRSVELVILAQRVAELAAEEEGAILHILGAPRRRTRLSADGLAGAFDDLEGQVRRRLNDKKIRSGEESLRVDAISAMTDVAELRGASAWPLGGADRERIDVVALRADGRPVAGASRKKLDLAALGDILDGVQSLRLAMPVVFDGAVPPVRYETPELLLASKEFSEAALHVLSTLALAHGLYAIETGRDRGVSLKSIGAEEAARSKRDIPARRRRQGGRGRKSEDEADEAPREEKSADSSAEATLESDRESRGASRRRGRRRGGRGGREGRDGRDGREVREREEESKPSASEEGSGFDEMSLFDLDDSENSEERSGGRRRGRSRQRGRRRGEKRREEGSGGEEKAADSGREAPSRAGTDSDDEEVFGDDITEVLSDIPDDLPALQATSTAEYAPDDLEDSSDGGDRDRQRERDKRRAVRKADIADVPVAVEAPRAPRRRAVIVAAADRDSVLTAVLLARDVRLLEGVWVYEQAELMNFFREVMPDVKEDVPIHLVGFVPSPATDVLQASALYRDRLSWYDHHPWPPEDLFALKQAIGEEAVHHAAGAGSTLPLVLATSTRRSRFSDKLVDLACGRFTEHDYERWGRLWWWRLGEIANKTGEIRSEIEPLLAGRPSDLAKEAAKAEVPAVPDEVDYVATRDFRLVHFAGYSMVVVQVGAGFDIQLTARVARERYGAQLSLGYHEGGDLFILSGEESGGRRTLDFGALAEHLSDKLDWVEALPDDDHVARFLVGGLEVHAERLNEVVGEIAMGRSILER
ncbi:MAG: hypothetical protein P8Q97_16595 [Myxococcota bacterium]|jgi:hypothetical protein|nr:hypothetical protein [Myxococcota bacterium]